MAAPAPSLLQGSVGVALLAAGLGGMAMLLVITHGHSAACQAWALRLGLALSLLLSAAAQTMVLLGGWLLWRSNLRSR